MDRNRVLPLNATSSLQVLFEALSDARDQLAAQRAGPSSWSPQTVQARADLLRALESYRAGLEAAHRPVPYRLRDEIRLYQALRHMRTNS
jgi:hypothetical protein